MNGGLLMALGEALLRHAPGALLSSAVLVLLAAGWERLPGVRAAARPRELLWWMTLLPLLVPPTVRVEIEGLAAPLAELAANSAPPPNAAGWLLWVWGLGSLVRAGWLVRHRHCLRRELGAASRPAGALDRALLVRAARRVGLARAPQLRIFDGPAPALVVGWWRPTVYVRRGLAPDAREAALWHECAHIARRDGWADAALELLHCVWWFHPALPLVQRRLRAAAELGADALALRGAGRDASGAADGAARYRALLVAEARELLARTPAGARGWLGAPSLARERLQALLAPRRKGPGPWALPGVYVALGLPLVLCGPAPAATAWWDDPRAVAAQLAQHLERRPGEGCAEGRLLALRALALGRAANPAPLVSDQPTFPTHR